MVRTAAIWVLALLASSALAQEEGKQEKKKEAPGPFRLPGLPSLKEKLGLTEEQAGKIEALYKEGAAKEQEIRKSAGQDRKKSREETATAKDSLAAKVKEVLSDEQDKTFDEMVQASRQRKAGAR